MSGATRAHICAVAIAEAFRGDGEMLVSPIGTLPALGARFAKRSFEPDLLLTDGVSQLLASAPPLGSTDAAELVPEGWLPYREVFEMLWSGRRHVMMGATQIDVFGNQNIACIGDPKKPTVQLLGMRGAPGNTINHPTSYWIPNHGPRVFVPDVDVVTGVGYDRAGELGDHSARFHEIRRVVSNLGVFDFETPERRMRVVSVHPGVSVDDVVGNTGFELVVPDAVPETRVPNADEIALLKTLDPDGLAAREVPE